VGSIDVRRFLLTRALRRRIFAAIAVLVVFVSHSVAAPLAAWSQALAAAVQDRRFSDAVRTFGALTHPTADDEYLAGNALMGLNRPDEAAPHLAAAKTRGWSRWGGWPSAESLLERGAEVRRLSPPALDPQVDASIEVHADPPTPWSAPIVRAVPEFTAVGRSIFGADAPRMRLYLFHDRTTFDRLYRALFGVEISTAWQRGAGGTNVVVFCEQEASGETARAAGDPNEIGDVLHEFGHAWCETYLMERYSRSWISPALRRSWLSEGVAEFVASLREPARLEREKTWLAKNAKSVAAPSFADLTSWDGFYKAKERDVYARYCLSAAFVAELLGPGDAAPAKIRAILDAVGKSGDTEASVSAATGKDLRKTFDEVRARFW
jgi:hypothetical protein